MNETARHTIPRRLDDPERWLFWTVDDHLHEAIFLTGIPDIRESLPHASSCR